MSSPEVMPTNARIQMDFYTALKRLRDGDCIRSSIWPAGEFGKLVNSQVQLWRNGDFYLWTITDGDLDATDWEIFI